MALQIVPSQNPPPVKASLILAFVGIPQPNPLRPNGRVFRKLAGHVPAFYLDENRNIVEMTYEQAFVVRVMRWMPKTMKAEYGALFERGITNAERAERIKAFMPKLLAHKRACPPPWQAELAQVAQERAA
ncbi:MAG TPA: hypothetical protein VJL61_06795 [Rhodanobacteraceae bacterium]|nr:hypothetical protein [Rhodanobacteraceae bacterium]